MVRAKTGFAAVVVAALAAGCAVDASSEKGAGTAAPAAAAATETEVGYITGSRLPRKATQNTQGVTQTSKEDWQRYNQPVAPLKSN